MSYRKCVMSILSLWYTQHKNKVKEISQGLYLFAWTLLRLGQVTERYVRADTRAKRKALENASKNILPESTYSKEKEEELMKFPKKLI